MVDWHGLHVATSVRTSLSQSHLSSPKLHWRVRVMVALHSPGGHWFHSLHGERHSGGVAVTQTKGIKVSFSQDVRYLTRHLQTKVEEENEEEAEGGGRGGRAEGQEEGQEKEEDEEEKENVEVDKKEERKS